MKLLLGCVAFCCFYVVNNQRSSPGADEDQRVINETLETYGPAMNYREFNLPGPQVEVDENRFLHPNKFILGESGTYTLRIRAIVEYFSYNSRYEEIKIRKEKDKEIPIIKGQFGEHFQRKNGGYYVRTIGYVIDGKGYRQFLLDLTKAQFIFYAPTVGGPGGPGSNKDGISSTVLGTLIGGNTLG